MNFYVDSGGVVLHVAPERIFQGSANANTIRFIGAFAPNLPVLVAFKLPNGVWTTPQSMGFSAQLSGVETNDGVQFNTWEYQIPQVITENYGTVNVQFYVYGDAGGTGGQIASAMSSFVVEKGVPITLPDPTDDYQTLLTQILAVLSQIQSEIGDLPNNYVPRSSGRHIVYVNDINGNPSTQIYAVDASGNIIVQRDGNGQIRVPLAPLQGYDATSKNYVDESIEALPSKYVTLDTDQTIDGIKGFTSPITVGGQTWRTSYMKDSFVYTVDGYSYEVTYPEKSGLMALKSDIPTDYATQGQLAQTNQNVEDLYTILEQAQVVTVTTLEQAYTTRETADGENIVDGVQTTVKEIRGKTVKTENLIPYPYAYPTVYTNNGVTFTVNSDGTITANGTATGGNALYYLSSLYTVKTPEKSYFSGCPSGGGSTTFSIQAYTREQKYFSDIGSGFLAPANSELNIVLIVANGTTVNNLVFRPMLNAGTTAKPYSKWFAGLKNASFEKIVSTGRNLIPYPYEESTKTENGITFTVNSDGSITANGTTTVNPSIFNLAKISLNAGTYALRSFVNVANAGICQFYIDIPSEPNDRTGNGVTFTLQDDIVNKNVNIIVDPSQTVNNLIKPMLQFGTTATAYEPYISDTLSAETPIELAEYDVVYPETGETKRQSNTLTFDGTEEWYLTGNAENNFYNYRYYTPISVEAQKTKVPCICNKYDYKLSVENDMGNDIGILVIRGYVYIRLGSNSTIKNAAEWKAHLAELAAAGNPVTVTYKTAESTTEATPFNKSKYIAWKNGSETIEQGETDNSEYGAENTVKQDYFTLTGGTTNV